jgi:hypothetical protein
MPKILTGPTPADLHARWIAGETIADLADRFDLSDSTVKSRLDRYRMGETVPKPATPPRDKAQLRAYRTRHYRHCKALGRCTRCPCAARPGKTTCWDCAVRVSAKDARAKARAA